MSRGTEYVLYFAYRDKNHVNITWKRKGLNPNSSN